MSHITGSDVQYITISVKPVRAGTKHFTIRLNSLDFKELQDRILRKIIILPNVKFHKTIQERFIDAFKEVIAGNPKYYTSQVFANIYTNQLISLINFFDYLHISQSFVPQGKMPLIPSIFSKLLENTPVMYYARFRYLIMYSN